MISSENPRTSPEGADEIEPVKIILAEDDTEDQELFLDALEEAMMLGITGTPSYFLNGAVLRGVHEVEALR